MLQLAEPDIVVLNPDAADDTAEEFIPESEDIKAEVSSWPLSGRTRDDDPTYTVFAYDEIYLGM